MPGAWDSCFTTAVLLGLQTVSPTATLATVWPTIDLHLSVCLLPLATLTPTFSELSKRPELHSHLAFFLLVQLYLLYNDFP